LIIVDVLALTGAFVGFESKPKRQQ